MKKKNLLVVLLNILLVSCQTNNNPSSTQESSTISQTIDPKSSIEDTVESSIIIELEENTPESWIDMFTFTNVTILLKNNLTIKRGDTYKCVDGSWYVKYQGFEMFEKHDGRNIFDLYLSHYSYFTYDKDFNNYQAINVAFDDSGYLHNVCIIVDPDNNNRIVSINDEAYLASSTIISSLDFSNYGETTLD